MRKVKSRALMTVLIALALLCGLAFFILRLSQDGGMWANYFSGNAPVGTVTDRNGVILYDNDGGGWSFAEDKTTRLSCYHAVGDVNGNVGTGVIARFRDEMTGYSFVGGTAEKRTLALTIDSKLNTAAYNALAGRHGAVMVMNYVSGEILCMVSAPADDPLCPSASPEDGCYLNKAISSAFTPGSVFKLITTAAAIENIEDLGSRRFSCGGSAEVGGSEIKCPGVHGVQNLKQALANSCNCAFSEISQTLGPDILKEYADKLGFTSEHSLNGIVTAAGNFDKAESGSPALSWSGIGQHTDLVCPYSMLRYVAAIANGGKLAEPTLLHSAARFGRNKELISPSTAKKLAGLMANNVKNGYGSWNFPGLSVCGKTGTAETGDGSSHGWFAGFLDDSAHPYAFVALVEKGGAGIASAAPVINTVLQAAAADFQGEQ